MVKDEFHREMERKEIVEKEEKKNSKIMSEKIKEILREDEYSKMCRNSYNSPSDKYLEKKR